MIRNIFFVLLMMFLFSSYAFAQNNYSIMFSWDQFQIQKHYTFQIIDDNYMSVHEIGNYQSFSTYFLLHNKIFIYGFQFSLPFHLPLKDSNNLYEPQLSFLFGFESMKIFNGIFNLQTGISLGILYLYINLPDDYNFNVSEFFFVYEFFLSIGIKISNHFNLKFHARYRYPYGWHNYCINEPYYGVAIEYFF